MARVQGASNGSTSGAASIAATFGAAITSGNAVVGIACFDGAANVTTVTDDKGNSYTVSDNVLDGTSGQRSISFVLGNITNAPTTITVNLSPGVGFRSIAMDEFGSISAVSDPRDGHTGQAQGSPGTGTDAITSGSITPTTNGCTIWGGYSANEGQAIATPGTGFASGTSWLSTPAELLTENLTQSTAAAIPATFTQAAGNGATCCFVMALKASGGGASSQPPYTQIPIPWYSDWA